MTVPLLETLDEGDRRQLLATGRRRRFRRGEVIFHEGDPGDAVHVVLAGHVAIRTTTPLGDTATVRIIAPGEFFGELALLNPAPRSATAAAVESAETLSIGHAQFDDLRRRLPHVTDLLVAVLSAEIRRLAAALQDALYLPADKRLWRRLVELADTYGEGQGPAIVPLTQEELAQLVGVTRPTANRLLRDGEEAGAIVLTRGRITVTDRSWIARRGR